jgi:3-hydroxyisobutyrate dehydrogenase
MTRVGFIGIGTMGWPMAANLAKAGFSVVVGDTDAGRTAAFCSEHAGNQVSSGNLAEIAACDVVITMLPTGKIVKDVLLKGDGGAFLAAAAPGLVVIDMSSSEPAGTRSLAASLEEKGIVLLDAPVSGAKPRATAGTLTIMLGGDNQAAIEKVQPVLLAMGNRIFRTGGCGTGHAVKALNNFLGATAFAATSEAVQLARSFGLDPATLIEIVNVSTGKSFISEVVMQEHVLDGKFATGFAVGLLAKDVAIAEDMADSVSLHTPVLHLVSERWQQASEILGFAADNTEAIKAWWQSENTAPTVKK